MAELGLEPGCLSSMATSGSEVPVGSEDQRTHWGWLTATQDLEAGSMEEEL